MPESRSITVNANDLGSESPSGLPGLVVSYGALMQWVRARRSPLGREPRPDASPKSRRLLQLGALEYLVSMVLTRNRLTMLVLILAACSAMTAQPAPSNVRSAMIENVEVVPGNASLHVNIRNTGQRAITAYSFDFYQTKPDGERSPCGGRGADMIDWSDPMPGRKIYVHMRRNWIPPSGTTTLDGYPRCPGETTPLESIQVELGFIMFDDGTGEGASRQMEFALRTRQQARNERLKWIDRFTALRNTPDLRSAAQSLYQDLVDATRSAEINPDEASREGMAKPVRDELQRLALDITQWAARNESLKKNDLLEWRIADLEQRTARLVRGAGSLDVNPY